VMLKDVEDKKAFSPATGSSCRWVKFCTACLQVGCLSCFALMATILEHYHQKQQEFIPFLTGWGIIRALGGARS
jgi:hypothetical protein